METTYEREIWQYRGGRWRQERVAVVAEQAVALQVNGQQLTTLMCTPQQLEALAVGFLFNEGWIDALDEVAEVRFCPEEGAVSLLLTHAIQPPAVWTRTSGCGGGRTRAAARPPVQPPGEVQLEPQAVVRLVRALFESQELYRRTGGVHTSALSDGERIVLAAEDIGRHNSLDKLAGLWLQGGRPAAPVLLTTGRVSAEMLQKAWRMGAAVVISRTSPSSLSVQMAAEHGLTLIGYARGGRFTVYSGQERILRSEPAWPHIA